MDINLNPNSVVTLIQLSLVPVFLLVAIGQMLNVLTGRLARVVDRARWYDEQVDGGEITQITPIQRAELQALKQRMRFANWAINLLTGAAILVCVTVFMLLLNGVVTTPFDLMILWLFMATMAAITGGLIAFFIEVGIASASLRINQYDI